MTPLGFILAEGLHLARAVQSGKVDIALNAITPTAERAQKVDFTRPYVVLRYRLAGLKSAGLGPQTDLAQLQLRVVVVRGLPEVTVRRALPRAPRALVTDTKAGVAAVLLGRANVVAEEDVGLSSSFAVSGGQEERAADALVG